MLKEISIRVLGPLFATMFGLFLLVCLPINPADHKQAEQKESIAAPISDTLSAENEVREDEDLTGESSKEDSSRAGYSFGLDSIDEEKAD